MTSIVIAAHNEAAVIGRCLDALLDEPARPLDITVVANGCTDTTADVARARTGVRVIELPVASKAAAFNTGDAAARGWPRVYLDADIVLSTAEVHRLSAAVSTGQALAAAPRRRLATDGRPLPVRAYYAVHTRLPVFRTALFGRGAIALSAAGRGRFDRFPDVIADDLFLDSQFTVEEKCEVPEVTAWVAAPRRTRDLVRRLSRVRAGNAALRHRRTGRPAPLAPGGGHPAPLAVAHRVRPASRLSWFRHVVLPRPWLAPAAVYYVGLTVAAALRARRRATGWGRDDSSRTVPR
jgi:glycosyltransferase involved in cell wall biosynthesis